jgi:hypothetical protein
MMTTAHRMTVARVPEGPVVADRHGFDGWDAEREKSSARAAAEATE